MNKLQKELIFKKYCDTCHFSPESHVRHTLVGHERIRHCYLFGSFTNIPTRPKKEFCINYVKK